MVVKKDKNEIIRLILEYFSLVREKKKRVRVLRKINFGKIQISDDVRDEEGSFIDASNKEASIMMDIYKVLAQENYDVGKQVKEFLITFRTKYESTVESVAYIPQQMKEIMQFVDKTVGDFMCSYNYGSDSNKKKHFREAIETYIFGKLYPILKRIYYYKSKEENGKLMEQSKQILAKMSNKEIMEYLMVER